MPDVLFLVSFPKLFLSSHRLVLVHVLLDSYTGVILVQMEVSQVSKSSPYSSKKKSRSTCNPSLLNARLVVCIISEDLRLEGHRVGVILAARDVLVSNSASPCMIRDVTSRLAQAALFLYRRGLRVCVSELFV